MTGSFHISGHEEALPLEDQAGQAGTWPVCGEGMGRNGSEADWLPSGTTHPPKLAFLFVHSLCFRHPVSLTSLLLQFLLPLHSDLGDISLLLSSLPLRTESKP